MKSRSRQAIIGIKDRREPAAVNTLHGAVLVVVETDSSIRPLTRPQIIFDLTLQQFQMQINMSTTGTDSGTTLAHAAS